MSEHTRSDALIRRSTTVAVLAVAVVAATVSYQHAYALVREFGEAGLTARLVPLTVDGLIYASSMVLLHCARRQLPVPRLARWLLGLGIAATLAANAAHGLDRGPVGAIVAAWPALALVGSYELLMMIIRATPAPARSPLNAESESHEVPIPKAGSSVAPKSAFADRSGEAPSTERVSPENSESAKPRTVALGATHESANGPWTDSWSARAVYEFSDELAEGRTPTIREIRSRLRVGQPRAQQVRERLSSLTNAASHATTRDGATKADAGS